MPEGNSIYRKILFFVITLFFFLQNNLVFSDYPEIKELNSEDILFKQLQAEILKFHKAQSRASVLNQNQNFPDLHFFLYSNQVDMDLFSLAARLNLPYDTLATLNNLTDASALKQKEQILIPSMPGIFVPLIPQNSFQEILIYVSMSARKNGREYIVRCGHESHSYLFFRGESFHAIERAYFLNILFRFPLTVGKLTSNYGHRPNPFTGHPEFHHGIDIAAPVGTEVFAARDGKVIAADYDPILGKYVTLLHDGGYQTVYGHLSVIIVCLKQKVNSGIIIGKVGSTGYSTGPHLHFEIRRKGATEDPIPLLPTLKEEKR